GAALTGQGLFTGLPTTGSFDGNDRTSQVPGGPLYERALLSDPGGTSALGHYRASMLPSAQRTASAPTTMLISGLNHTARPFAVYASQSELLHHHARLASGWLANLSGRTGYPLGPTERFQIISSSFPRLHLAHPSPNSRANLPSTWCPPITTAPTAPGSNSPSSRITSCGAFNCIRLWLLPNRARASAPIATESPA